MKKSDLKSFDLSKEQIKLLLSHIDVAEYRGRYYVDEALELFNEYVHGYGIETISDYPLDIPDSSYYFSMNVLYVNMGDSYALTLMYDTSKEEFLVGSWGNWVEETEMYLEREAIKEML